MSEPDAGSGAGRWGVRVAGDGDAADLLRLYECDAAAGDLAVLTTRRPDPLASLRTEGDRVVFPVVTDNESGRVIGGGACVIRRASVGGVDRTVCYLTGLKLLPEYRRQVPLMARIYGWARELTADVDLYYTTIMADNAAAQRLLTGRRRRGMPEYRPAGGYTTWCFRTPPVRLPRWGLRLELGTASDLVSPGFDLEPVRPLAPESWVLRDRSGAVVASAGVWDQRAHRQYIVLRYGGAYEHLHRLPTALIGYPRLPRPGAVAAQASVTQLWVRDWDPALARLFLGALSRVHRRFDYLVWGAHASHPLAGPLAGLRGVRLDSLLYTVHFDDACLPLSGGPVGLDVALL
nr:hypothetical protein [Propionibacterium sp.]